MSQTLNIRQAEKNEDIAIVQVLFREYETWLGMDLCFQGFEGELHTLPGRYASPDGRLYLATVDDAPAGCIAMRKLEDGICEMKRLFLKAEARGLGLGKMLVKKLIGDAREIGYSKMRLDTHPPKMGKAVSIYESLGFRPIPAYYNNPHEGVLFMELDL